MIIKNIQALSGFNFGINAVNRGEDKLQKYIPEINKNFISGDKILYCITETVRNLNDDDPKKGNTYLSYGDQRNPNIKDDIASDFCGYMITEKQTGGKKRNGVICTCNVISKNERSDIYNFKVKFDTNGTSHTTINDVLSLEDEYIIPFNISKVSDLSFDHYEKKYVNDSDEIKRRISMYLNAMINLKGLASQHTNMVNNMSNYVLYVISSTYNVPVLSLNQYSETDMKRYDQSLRVINNLVAEGKAVIFEGGINPFTNKECELTVIEAMEKAQEFVKENELYQNKK